MTEDKKLFNQLRGLYYNLQKLEFEQQQLKIVMEGGQLTEEEVNQLSGGDTFSQLAHQQEAIEGEIMRLLGYVHEILDSAEEMISIGSEEGKGSK